MERLVIDVDWRNNLMICETAAVARYSTQETVGRGEMLSCCPRNNITHDGLHGPMTHLRIRRPDSLNYSYLPLETTPILY
jgi:hypothetical protein